ncbi:hypothetical protein D9613_008806 [Agrocybe pediades]|uniref:Uncharacterized protein n=1 Tax=Agrocybe pediades TaxID=84607 RepID=A0A8H4QU14_9AGAR|nr:hypothetical protein D9613_008806 [Agrocybe pediades]
METSTPSQDEYRARTKRNVENINCGTTRVPPNLPAELHKLIVDELKSEKKALKQCALTCRLYRHFSQKLLFKKVVFKFSGSPNPTSHDAEFLDIIRASPHIVNYVQQLHLHENEPRGPHPIAKSSRARSIPPEIFQTLTNVVDLILGWKRRLHGFSRMHSPTRLAIMDKCEHLLNLTVRNMYAVPLKIFDHLHRLEKLTLDGVHFSDNPDAAQVAQATPCRIKHMNLGAAGVHKGTVTLFPFFVSKGIGMGTLETLTIDITQGDRSGAFPITDFQAAKSLIRSSAGSLKVLKVIISTSMPLTLPDAEPLFDLSEMPLLEEWSLEGKVCYNNGPGTGRAVGLGWLSRHLETIPSGRKFKSITLRPNIIIEDDKVDFESLKYFESLAVEKVSSHTESFLIHFPTYEDVDESDDEWGEVSEDESDGNSIIQEQIQKYLPILHGLNVLQFRQRWSREGLI